MTAMKRMMAYFFALDSTHYKRWGTVDIGLRSNYFPSDLIRQFEEEGTWRPNITEITGAFQACDMFHETAFNKNIKSCINRNMMSKAIFANIG